MIVQNNHIAGTGFIPVNDGFIQKKRVVDAYKVEVKSIKHSQ